MKCPMST